MLTEADSIERTRDILKSCDKVVALLGIGTVMECGALNYLNNEVIYRIEDTYHRSPEEIMSSGFYSARTENFFKYYKDEYLQDTCEPNDTYRALKKLDDDGKLYACITQNTHGLEKKIGIHHVIEIYGNRNNNWCTKCGKHFDMDYILHSRGVPVCDECQGVIRPGIRLFGEMIRNDVMTEAASACQNAEALIVLGTNFYDPMVCFALNHYQGDNLILISKHVHYLDKSADIIIHRQVKDVLPGMIL